VFFLLKVLGIPNYSLIIDQGADIKLILFLVNKKPWFHTVKDRLKNHETFKTLYIEIA